MTTKSSRKRGDQYAICCYLTCIVYNNGNRNKNYYETCKERKVTMHRKKQAKQTACDRPDMWDLEKTIA